eukprot:6172832-Pleurochrysis_carterae.AAC.3
MGSERSKACRRCRRVGREDVRVLCCTEVTAQQISRQDVFSSICAAARERGSISSQLRWREEKRRATGERNRDARVEKNSEKAEVGCERVEDADMAERDVQMAYKQTKSDPLLSAWIASERDAFRPGSARLRVRRGVDEGDVVESQRGATRK